MHASLTDTRLPDPLRFADGRPVQTADDWRARRAEVLDLLARHEYGRTPTIPVTARHEVVEESRDALGGRAVRRQVRLTLTGPAGELSADVLVMVPKEATGPVPAFLGLNFYGNHTTAADLALRLPRGWVPNREAAGAADNRATEAGRGASASRWPYERALARGYGMVTAYCGDFDPDYHDGFGNGAHALFSPAAAGGDRPAEAWGTIGAWAWGLSRVMDYLETDPSIDAGRVAVHGHSRLGKTSLWAGAQDERFALVISNDSGCGGAALFRHEAPHRETIAKINHQFPHWFCGQFKQYDHVPVADLPIDQHLLIAAVAPRPVSVGSAAEDLWANPQGEFLSLVGADPVYRLLGTSGLAEKVWPGDGGRDIEGVLSYHIRPGKHDQNAEDWERYLRAADRHLKPRA